MDELQILRERYEALMEGLGLDPSPECYEEYTPGRLRAEGYGWRMRAAQLEAELYREKIRSANRKRRYDEMVAQSHALSKLLNEKDE